MENIFAFIYDNIETINIFGNSHPYRDDRAVSKTLFEHCQELLATPNALDSLAIPRDVVNGVVTELNRDCVRADISVRVRLFNYM